MNRREQLRERRYTQLAEDLLAVILDRMSADPEPERDGIARTAEQQQIAHLVLARRETRAERGVLPGQGRTIAYGWDGHLLV